jgi:shikimate dehydrogenase
MSLVHQGVGQLTIVELDAKKRARLRRDLKALASHGEINFTAPASALLQSALTQADLIVNATPLGLKPSDPLPLPKDWMPGRRCVMDLAYGRGLTKLLTLARQKRNTLIPGWEMLLYQGADAFRLWTSRQAPVGVMEKALWTAAKLGKHPNGKTAYRERSRS